MNQLFEQSDLYEQTDHTSPAMKIYESRSDIYEQSDINTPIRPQRRQGQAYPAPFQDTSTDEMTTVKSLLKAKLRLNAQLVATQDHIDDMQRR